MTRFDARRGERGGVTLREVATLSADFYGGADYEVQVVQLDLVGLGQFCWIMICSLVKTVRLAPLWGLGKFANGGLVRQTNGA